MGKSSEKRKHRKDRRRSRSRSRDRSRESDRDRSYKSQRRRTPSSSDDSSSDGKRRGRYLGSPQRKQKSRRERSRSPVKRKKGEHRPLTKEDKIKQKELLKATETLEEKRLRRIQKKEAKDRKRKEKMGWDEEMMGYTNEDNPFGDPNLLDTFVWQKKNETLGLSQVDPEKLRRMGKGQQIENRLELQKVKQRRLEREREREERDKELEDLQRMREAEYFQEWEKQEDQFHLDQAKLRSKIRIQDGRAKPIDQLAQYIGQEKNEEDLTIEMQEPYNILTGFTIRDLEDLLEDIKVYLEMEKHTNLEFWKDITTITDDELAKLRKIDPDSQIAQDRREGINASVSREVGGIFQGKTHSQLVALQNQINERIKSGSAVDIGYWETLLQQLSSHMARARLKERHQDRLRNKLAILRQQQGVEAAALFPSVLPINSGEGPSTSASTSAESLESKNKTEEIDPDEEPRDPRNERKAERNPEKEEEEEEEEDEERSAVLTEEDLIAESMEEYLQGSYSPKLTDPKDVSFDVMVYDPEEDMAKLEQARKQLLATGSAEATMESEFIKKAKEGMGLDEGTFGVEMALDDKPYLWADKYRPRKPRYFNRVHTGFEWNKYNQTHYDMDNPPPKVVQGYKFNIFYPDLIDKRNTPEYSLSPSPDNKEFAILTFNAGPPYEDLAFKIVNREWELSHRHGFRCQFNNSIFQLWFRFKRYRYRR
ncbi:splicing factor Cactin-like isoform X2 [Apostichopus japonicus]|uniref:splicing factor Cactin-like isoform X2 n=1 Tax=Stichopus japonicus TaxID=307972 RepID=UPI003AB5EC14